MSTTKKIIAVIGATGNQGGSVVNALQARGEFHVRALTRNPNKHQGIGDEVVEADLDRPETLKAAFEDAYGVFAVTNFWENGTDEMAQATAAVNAAKAAGVQYFIWSTLPNVEKISGGKFEVPHFTAKAKVDAVVKEAGFAHYTFVIAPFFFPKLERSACTKSATGRFYRLDNANRPNGESYPYGRHHRTWGGVVAGAFTYSDKAGNGQYLPLVGNLLSFDDIIKTLNQQGHNFTFNQVPIEVFSGFFEGAGELAQMFAYFETYTYLGGNYDIGIKLANKLGGKRATDFADWAKKNFESTVMAKSA